MAAVSLAGVPLFAQLTREDLRQVEGAGRTWAAGDGQVLIREGDEADALHVTLAGQVRVTGACGAVLAELGPGSVLGEVALVDGGRRSATVTCVGACRFFTLDRPAFYALLGRSPELASRVFVELGARLRNANQVVRAQHVRGAALEEENRRLATELEVARRLQVMALPRAEELAAIPGLEVDGYMEPAAEVGGDYYDVLARDGHVRLAIGDVTGHGLESGVLALMVQSAMRTLTLAGHDDAVDVLETINQVVRRNALRMDSSSVLTLCLLDYREGVLRVAGQHEVVMLLRADGTVESLDTEPLGMLVGLEDGLSRWLGERTVHVGHGDAVVLHTDGLTEAMDQEDRCYGLERLEACLRRCRGLGARQVREAVVEDLRLFRGRRALADDVTVVVVRRR